MEKMEERENWIQFTFNLMRKSKDFHEKNDF